MSDKKDAIEKLAKQITQSNKHVHRLMKFYSECPVCKATIKNGNKLMFWKGRYVHMGNCWQNLDKDKMRVKK